MLTENEILIVERTQYLLNIARKTYGTFGEVKIDFDNKGNAHAKAIKSLNELCISYSKEAIEKYFEETLTDTIPHEVSHIVSMALYKNSKHNKQWKKICKQLGGTGKCYTTSIVTPQRIHKYYKYVLDSGFIIWLSSTRHKKIQRKTYIIKKTKEHIKKIHFTGIVGTQLDIMKELNL